MKQKTIVVLGGGIGGQSTANILASGLGDRHRVILIDRDDTFLFPPSLLWVITGQRAPKKIQRPLSELLNKNVEFVKAEIIKIDPVSKIIQTSSGEYRGDYLVICLGAEVLADKIPGFREGAINLYTLDGCVRLHHFLETFSGERLAILITSTPFKCPAAPYEAAFLIRDFLNQQRQSADISIFTPEPFPMPTAGPAVGAALRETLESKNIRFNPNLKVVKIDPVGRSVEFENGHKEHFGVLVGIAPHQVPRVIFESNLASSNGWVPVHRETMATKFKDVFAVGDCAFIALAQNKALPKAGVFAHLQAEVVAKNIISQIKGETPGAKFDGKGWCAIETGNGQAAFGDGDFYADEGPKVNLFRSSSFWHWGKILFEQWWLTPLGPRRQILEAVLNFGVKIIGKFFTLQS